MKKLNIRKKYSDLKHTGIELLKGSKKKVEYFGDSKSAPLIMKIAPVIETNGVVSRVVDIAKDGILQFKTTQPGHLCIDWGDGSEIENRIDLPENFSHEYGSNLGENDTVDIKIYCFDDSVKTVFDWSGDTEKKTKRIKNIISWGNLSYSKLPSFTNLQIQTEYSLDFPADIFGAFSGVTEFDEELYLYNATIDPDFWKYVPVSGKVKKLIYGRGTLDYSTLFKNITGKFPNLETVERLLLGSLPAKIDSITDFVTQAGDFLAAQTKLVNCPSFFYTEKPDFGIAHQRHSVNIPDSISNKSFENIYNFFGGKNVFSFKDSNIPSNFLSNSPNLKNISYLFYKQEDITQLPESLFIDKPHLRDLSYAFADCEELASIPESFKTLNWGGSDKNPGVNMTRAFANCDHLTGIAPDVWNLTNDELGTKIIDGLGCFIKCRRLDNYDSIPAYWTDGEVAGIPVIRSLKINGSEDLIVNCPDTTVKVNYDVFSTAKIIKYWIGTDKDNLSEVSVNWELGDELSLSGYINYTLQWMEAPQTLYFKVGTETGESDLYARQVSVPTKDWRLESIKLAGVENFGGIYDSENISIVPSIVGSKAIPQRYIISLDPEFTGADWKLWDGQNISYTLPYTAEGDKFTVYLKMDDDYSYVSDVKTLEIQVNKLPIFETLSLETPVIKRYGFTDIVETTALEFKLLVKDKHLYNNPVTGWIVSENPGDTNYILSGITPNDGEYFRTTYTLSSRENKDTTVYVKIKNNNGEVIESKTVNFSFVYLEDNCFNPHPHTTLNTTTRDIKLKYQKEFKENHGITQVMVYEGLDRSFEGATWQDWNGVDLIPFTLSSLEIVYVPESPYVKPIRIKVRNAEGDESNISTRDISLTFPQGADHTDAEINSEYWETTETVNGDSINIPFEFYLNFEEGDPNECYVMVGEDQEFTDAVWYKIPEEENNPTGYGATGTYHYVFLNQEDGEKTLYFKRRINDVYVGPVSVKKVIKNTLPPIDYTTETVNLSFVAPEGTNPEDVNLSFPKLKYNKKMVFSWINDDSYTIWNSIVAPVNKKYVSNGVGTNPWNSEQTDWTFFYHDGMERGIYNSTGYIPTKPIEYTDGCGVSHRFTSSVAVWPDRLFAPEGPDNTDLVMGGSWLWVGAREAKKMADYGYTLIWHDVFNNGDTEDQEVFDQRMTEKIPIFQKAYGKTPKSMAEPNGNHAYLDFCANNDTIQFVTAQTGDSRIRSAYPYAPDFSLSKHDITVHRIFFSGTSESYRADLIAKLQQAHDTTELETIPWIIGSGHRSSLETDTAIFTQIEELFGASGDDSIWVPSVDEFYEYWYMTAGTKITKTISGQEVNFKLDIPVKDNFWFKNLSCLVSGLPDTTGVKESEECDAFSYGMSGDQVLVNFGWSGETYEIAHKYVDNAMVSFKAEDYSDAMYFSQLVKPTYKELLVNTLKQTWHDGYSHEILGLFVNGDTGAEDITVTSTRIQVSTSEEGMMKFDWLMISEDPEFTESTGWIPTNSGTEYVLTGTGEHTLYLKVKDDLGVESNVVSRKVILDLPPILLNRIYPAPSSATTKPEININFDYKTVAEGGSEFAYYRTALGTAATDTIPDDVPWIKWGKALTSVLVTFPEGEELGEKYVLAQVKDIYDQVSEVKSAQVRYEAPLEITKFMVNSSSESSVTTYCRLLNFDCESNYSVNYYYISYDSNHSNRIQVKDSTTMANFSLPEDGTEFTIYPQAVRDLQVIDIPAVTVIVEEAPAESKILLANVNADVNYLDVETVGRVNKQVLRNITKENWIYDTTGKLCGINTGQWENNNTFKANLEKFYTKWDKEYASYGAGIYWTRPVFSVANSGEYPDDLILGETKASYPAIVFWGLKQGKVEEKRLPGVFLRGLNPGTYKVRMLLTSGRTDFTVSAWDVKGLHYYQVNDQVINPPDVSVYLNNNTQWLEFDNVTVDIDGLMMIGYYLQFPEDTSTTLDVLSTVPFPIVEIIRK